MFEKLFLFNIIQSSSLPPYICKQGIIGLLKQIQRELRKLVKFSLSFNYCETVLVKICARFPDPLLAFRLPDTLDRLRESPDFTLSRSLAPSSFQPSITVRNETNETNETIISFLRIEIFVNVQNDRLYF